MFLVQLLYPLLIPSRVYHFFCVCNINRLNYNLKICAYIYSVRHKQRNIFAQRINPCLTKI